MRARLFWVLYVGSTLCASGCGRIGVEFLSADELGIDAGRSGEDASEPPLPPELSDGSVEPSDSSVEVGGDSGSAGSDAESPPIPDGGADQDGTTADADMSDTGPAATDAMVADCQLTVGGAVVGYRTGDVGQLEGTHILQLVDAGFCAAPLGCDAAHGANVVQSSCAIAPCRMWDSVDLGGGWFALRNALTGACLYMANTSDDTNAITWACVDADKTRWQAVCAGDDTWHLISDHARKQIGAGASMALGGGIVQAAQSSSAQRWRITSNARAYDAIIASAETDASAVWRFTTTTPAPGWNQTSFDDASWSTGPGAFGDVGPRGFTEKRTDWTTPDIWLRRSFSLSSLPSSLSLQIFHDEGAEVFINGVMAATLTGWSHGYRSIDVPMSVMSALVVGNNTIAVHCHHVTAPQFIDVGLVTYTWR